MLGEIQATVSHWTIRSVKMQLLFLSPPNKRRTMTKFALSLFVVSLVLPSADICVGREVRGIILEAGEPVAARLYIESSEGKFYHAEPTDSNAGQAVPYRVERGKSREVHTALPAGEFSANLPPGRYTWTVRRGKEYREVSRNVVVPDGDAPIERVELTIQRWIHMADRGWYSGDTHVHRSVEQTVGVVEAEDLNIAFPLTYWVTQAHQAPTRAAKSVKSPPGNQAVRVTSRNLVYPLNTEYELFTYGGKRHTLGAVFVIGHQQPLELAAPPAVPIAEEARRQGALLDLDKHTWPWSAMIVPVMEVDLFELSNNHIWRTEFLFRDWTIDTLPTDWQIETDADGGWTEHGWTDFGFKTYYAFLNCGFDMQPTGGTATGVHPVPMGFGRVYVQLDGPFTHDAWLKGLKGGRSFVTTGPMLIAQFDGQPAGSTFQRKGDTPCRITGRAIGEQPLDRVEIIVNGNVAKTIRSDEQVQRLPRGGYPLEFDTTLRLNESSWVAVRCFQPRDNGRYFFAHTAPAHYVVDGREVQPRVKEVRYLLQRVQEELTRNEGVLTEAELGEFRQAESIYKALLQRAK